MSRPTIEFVFIDGRKPGALGVVNQMTDAKQLFHDVSDLGDFFVSFNFLFSQFGRG